MGDVWSAAWVGEELNVVTNFGLLRRRSQGWHLDCEEVLGDTLTAAHFTGTAEVAVTGSGYFLRQPGICKFEGPDESVDDWLYGLALANPGTRDAGTPDAGTSETVAVALYIDRATSDSKVALGPLGEPLSEVATFSWELGIERVVAGGKPARAYVTGYSYPPRVWHVRSALLAEDVEFQASDLEREGELAEMRPMAVDPVDSSKLWLRAAVTTDDPDGLWRFDSGSETLTRVFTLGRKEKLADIAFSDGRIFVAGRDEGRSVVYVASLDELEFEPIATLDAMLTCLDVDGERWLLCNSDFTRESPFIVATSDDAGETFTPELRVEDLAAVTSCGETCGATTGWLYGVYGAAQGGGTGSGIRDFDASALDPESDGNDAGASSGPAARPASCGCRLDGARGARWSSWFGGLVLVGLGVRRASTRVRR